MCLAVQAHLIATAAMVLAAIRGDLLAFTMVPLCWLLFHALHAGFGPRAGPHTLQGSEQQSDDQQQRKG